MSLKEKKNRLYRRKITEHINTPNNLEVFFVYFINHPFVPIKAFLYYIQKGPKAFLYKMKKIRKRQLFYGVRIELMEHWLIMIEKAIKILFTQGPEELIKKIREKDISRSYIRKINRQYQIWYRNHYPLEDILLKQKKEIDQMKKKPLISIVMPVYNPNIRHFRECIESVLAQSYENWQLCLADDCSPNGEVREVIKEYAVKDKRIVYVFREKNGHICAASNDAIALAKGEWIALLDNDDILWPNALYENVKLINEKPSTQFIYSDEDKIEEDGATHSDPFFKPDWSPDFLRSCNYITHFTVLRKGLVDLTKGFRLGYEGAQDWDLFLRITNELTKKGHCHPLDPENPIQHIQTVLYSWRKSPTSTASEKNVGKTKPYAYISQKKVLEDDLKQRNCKGLVEETKYIGLWRVRYEIKGSPLVSIIIPTKNQYSYIKKCLNSIQKKSTYINYELVIVDTGSTDKKVFELYKKIKKEHNNTVVLNWDKEFNFSAVCNYGAQKSRGEYLLFLNNDTEVITPDWIESMLEQAQRPEVGVVGANLLYPNGLIQHVGLVFGEEKYLIADERAFVSNYFQHTNPQINYGIASFFSITSRNITAVVASCILVTKNKYVSIHGFDPSLRTLYRDVDFCLKLFKERGLFNVMTPYSILYHSESIYKEKANPNNKTLQLYKKEAQYLKKKWGKMLEKDHFYNPNLSLQKKLPIIKNNTTSI